MVTILFWFAILVCVSVVSSLGFSVIFPWKMSASFLSASSFSVPKGENGAAGSVLFSVIVNYVAPWVSE